MKVLLVGINAKYIQTNLAIRLLRSYAVRYSVSVKSGNSTVYIREWNINQPVSAIVRGIYESGADLVLFSTYIWNRDYVFRVADEIRLIRPIIQIGFGGPEVSWSKEKVFSDNGSVDFIVSGEGEETVCGIIDSLAVHNGIDDIPGICLRGKKKPHIARNPIENLDTIPFPYDEAVLDFDPENHIVYYESSRGCPFSCAYCLSSIDKGIRYYSLERVFTDLDFFLQHRFPLVKFVDRTFNLDQRRYMAIWEYIRDHHNGKTMFHFEIAAEYLSDEALQLLHTMPAGSIQFEIGIQSTNPETLAAVGRPSHPEILEKKIRAIPSAIHVHVDLIAGLPGEGIESFSRSFNYAFALHPGMLQLGFLKILSGTKMEEIANGTQGYTRSAIPPYEVLESPDIPYGDMLRLKDIEYVVDTWYNSGLMKFTLEEITRALFGQNAFQACTELTKHIRSFYSDGDLYLPRKPIDSFACMAAFLSGKNGDKTRSMEFLRYDFLLQGKPGSFPVWFERKYSKEKHDAALLAHGLTGSGLESRRTSYAHTEYEEFLFDEKEAILFVYGDKKSAKSTVRTIRL